MTRGKRVEPEMGMKDNLRKWMWLFLVVLAAVQLYAVRELLAAFAIFVLGFGAIALCVGTLYFLHKTWEAGVRWAVASQASGVFDGAPQRGDGGELGKDGDSATGFGTCP